MDREVVPVLVKFFSQESHADQFIAGDLRLNRLGYFKKLEGSDGRPDRYEAIAAWYQPHNLSIEFSLFPQLNIRGEDLAGPVSLSFDDYDYLNIYCMSAIVVPETALRQPHFETNEVEAEEIRKAITFDERCIQFGEHAVIIETAAFVRQISKTLGRRFWLRTGLVEYYDDELFHGSFKRDEIPFRKQKRFKYQREFRICLDTGTRDNAPITLNIGKIDAAMKVRTRELNDLFQLRTEPVAA
jgi:hypothetical protein